MPIRTFYSMFKLINLRIPSVIYCIGAMGSGKTTLSILGYLALSRRDHTVLHYYNAQDCELECLDRAIIDIRSDPKQSISYVVLDDYSFILRPRSKDYYEFFNKLFRVRHITGKDKIVIWFNGHYSKSLAPFIRSTNYRVLTSISPAEISQYSSEYLFRTEDLWEYYNYYVSHPRNHIILVEFRGVSKIIDVTITDKLPRKVSKLYKEVVEKNRVIKETCLRETEMIIKTT